MSGDVKSKIKIVADHLGIEEEKLLEAQALSMT